MPSAKLRSVNLGRPRPDGDRKAKTGIYKEPIFEPVEVGEFGLQGDSVLNKKHHGGKDQAVYLYADEDYAWWSSELGRELEPGTFGENLTTEGVDVNALAIGDRLTIGEVVLEATAPRIPCATLARRMEDGTFVKRFMAARRPGAYFRVVRPGSLKAGEAITLQRYEGERVGLLELFDDYPQAHLGEEALRRQLTAPIAERARTQKETQLAALLAGRVPKS